MPKLGPTLIIVGMLLLVTGGAFSPAFPSTMTSFQGSVGNTTFGASAQGITPIQAGSIMAGIVLFIAGIYLQNRSV